MLGVDAYNKNTAKSLRLHYADRDANDLASAIVGTQGSLYQVQPQVLLNKEASKSGILRALKVMRASMAAGAGNDLAVVRFSGHGAMVDHKPAWCTDRMSRGNNPFPILGQRTRT